MDINLSLITPGLQNLFFWPTGAKIVAHKQTTAQCNFSHAAFGVKGMTVLFSSWVANTLKLMLFSPVITFMHLSISTMSYKPQQSEG